MDFNCSDLMKSVLSTEILDDELRHAFDEILFNTVAAVLSLSTAYPIE